jgi:hypothetical protein
MAVVGEGREVSKVEISTDGGVTWEPARLLNYFASNVWKKWEFTWEVSQIGDYVISARAEDDSGNQQLKEGFFRIENFSVSVTVDYDSDGDDLPDSEDNYLYTHNPDQENIFLPQQNNIGDAYDCKGDFDCDADKAEETSP